jgi:putative restriction endonuclease
MSAGTASRAPDEMANALALCALHHALFDLGVLGITGDRRICVSSLYVARTEAGRAVDALADKRCWSRDRNSPQ